MLLKAIRQTPGIRFKELKQLDPIAGSLIYRMIKRGLIEKRGGHRGGFYATNIIALSA